MVRAPGFHGTLLRKWRFSTVRQELREAIPPSRLHSNLTSRGGNRLQIINWFNNAPLYCMYVCRYNLNSFHDACKPTEVRHLRRRKWGLMQLAEEVNIGDRCDDLQEGILMHGYSFPPLPSILFRLLHTAHVFGALLYFPHPCSVFVSDYIMHDNLRGQRRQIGIYCGCCWCTCTTCSRALRILFFPLNSNRRRREMRRFWGARFGRFQDLRPMHPCTHADQDP